ncbi:MAG TPA: ABC transporter permease [Firmicutes bacterium]|nr:ABC transporter permease [Bacillota bacterium]
MLSYIARRLLWGLVIIWLVTLIVFFAIRLLPGDPLLIFIAQSQDLGQMTQEQLYALREQYGLNDPIIVQYVNWVADLMRGDLGLSITYRENVGELMLERLPVTLHLGLTGFFISLTLGTLAGLIAALRRGTWIDTLVTVVSYTGIAIPVFWLGYLLILFFGLKLGWLPIAGYTSPFDDFWLSTKQLVMPVFCMCLPGIAGMARQMRSSVLEVSKQDYVRTAWSKGLTEKAVVVRHILKNSLIPIITLLGMSIGGIFGGSVLVENIFAIPGMGRLLVQSILGQDYVIIQASTLIMALIIILSNLFVDISYGWFDPRIRYD